MTSGTQIREYHHLDDVVKSVDIIINTKEKGVLEITAGNGVRLRDLASEIFTKFSLDNLLNIGKIDIEHEEKFLNDYKKNPLLAEVSFRDPIKGVIDYLKTVL